MKVNVTDLGTDPKTQEEILQLEFDDEALEKITKICNEYNLTIEELCIKYLEWVVEKPEESTKTIKRWLDEKDD